MVAVRTCLLALLIGSVLGLFRGAEAQLGGSGTTMSFALTLRVPQDRWEASLEETKMLWEYAKEKKVGSNVELFLRGAYEKVNSTIVQVREKITRDKADAAAKAAAPVVHRFTEPYTVKDGKVEGEAVRPLKDSAAAPKNTVKEYTLAQVQSKISEHKLDLTRPFLIKGGVTELEKLQAEYTATKLANNTAFSLRYFTPADAKAKRTFDTAEEQQQAQQEQYKPHMITFEKYLKNCFNYNAKPDFKKQPGTSTEHCEQFVSAQSVTPAIKDYTIEATARLGWLRDLDEAKAAFVNKGSEAFRPMLSTALPEGASVSDAFGIGADSRLFSMGPSGSGEQMRQEHTAFVDGLIHGKRRWLFMQPENFLELRASAKEVLEPASGFMFFEQQLGELIEDFGLGSKKKKYYETNQEPGDLLFVPSSLVRVSVNLEDSISIFERLLTSQTAAAKSIDQNIWAPSSGRIPDGYAASACFGWNLGMTAEALGGGAPQGMQGQIVGQIMQQQFGGSVGSENYLILKVLAECAAAIEAPSVNAARTMCEKVWAPCTRRLEGNVQGMGVAWPSADVLPKTVSVVDSGDEQAQVADSPGAGGEVEDDDVDEAEKKKTKKKGGKKKKTSKKKGGKSEL